MLVRPVAGRKVRDYRTRRHLPSEGQEVPDGDVFWLRRLRDGDVEIVKPTAPVAADAPAVKE